jgi:hypothetical protein
MHIEAELPGKWLDPDRQEKPAWGSGHCRGCIKAPPGTEVYCKVCEPEYERNDDNVIYKKQGEGLDE